MAADDYRPVSCAVHSEYELAIVQGRRLHLVWTDADGQQHAACLQPTDLVTRDGAEYLLARDRDGHPQRIRLDRIRHHRPC